MSSSQNSISKQQITVQVLSPKQRGRFNQLLKKHHYLGATPPVGDFIEQVVLCDGKWAALLIWGPAALKLKDRERWIGWNPLQRAERLKLVVQNRRFLLLHKKGTQPHLASKALAAACKHLPAQWQERFGYRPLIAETFTDPEQFHGTCYKASGWDAVGMSQGSRRDHVDFYVDEKHPKRLWLKELCPKARKTIASTQLPHQFNEATVAAANGILPLPPASQRSLFETFQKVKDPRRSNNRFPIGSVLTLIAMALLSGAKQISEIARFAQRLRPNQRAQLRLPLKRGTRRFYQVPSYSVFYQLLTRINPEEFARMLSDWLTQEEGHLPGVLALDGKMIRDVIGTVTLANVEDGSPRAMAIMDQKEDTDRCELKAAQELLQAQPGLDGVTVTADPLHCQKQSARIIAEKGGEYFLQIKGNQPNLLKKAQQQIKPSPFLPRSIMGMDG